MVYLCAKCDEFIDDDYDPGTEYGDGFICEECLADVEEYETEQPNRS